MLTRIPCSRCGTRTCTARDWLTLRILRSTEHFEASNEIFGRLLANFHWQKNGKTHEFIISAFLLLQKTNWQSVFHAPVVCWSIASLTMLLRNSWLITGQTHITFDRLSTLSLRMLLVYTATFRFITLQVFSSSTIFAVSVAITPGEHWN